MPHFWVVPPSPVLYSVNMDVAENQHAASLSGCSEPAAQLAAQLAARLDAPSAEPFHRRDESGPDVKSDAVTGDTAKRGPLASDKVVVERSGLRVVRVDPPAGRMAGDSLPEFNPLPIEPIEEPSDVTPPEVRDLVPGEKTTDLTIRSHLVQAALDGKTVGPSTGPSSPEWKALKSSGDDLWREALDLKEYFRGCGNTASRSRGMAVWEMCERYGTTKESLVAQGKIVRSDPCDPAPAGAEDADDSTEKDGGSNGEQPADLAEPVEVASPADLEAEKPLPGWIGDFDADHKANIFWVAGALAPDFTGRAPNPIAAALLEFAKLNQLAFWSQIYSKAAAAKKDEDKDDRFKDDGRKMRDLLDKLEGLAKESAKTKKRVKKVEDVVGVRGGDES